MFKASENATEGTGLSYLDTPYLGPAKAQKVELTEVNGTPDCFQITFGNLEGNDYKGNSVSSSTTFQHLEWAPSEGDADEDTQKKVDRIAYIAGRYAPKDRVEAVEATGWVEWCEAIIQLMRQHSFTDKQVYIKAMGSVWQGKPRVKFPGYRDFLSTEPNDLSWSASERESNEEYFDALGSAPSPASEEEVVDNVEEAEF